MLARVRRPRVAGRFAEPLAALARESSEPLLEERRDEQLSPSSSELCELPEHESSCAPLESLESPLHDSSPSAALESPEQESSSLSSLVVVASPEQDSELSESYGSLLPEQESSLRALDAVFALQVTCGSLTMTAPPLSSSSSGSGVTPTSPGRSGTAPPPDDGSAGDAEVGRQPELSMRDGGYQGPTALASAIDSARACPGSTLAVTRVSQEFSGTRPASASATSSASPQRRASAARVPGSSLASHCERAGQSAGNGDGDGQLGATTQSPAAAT